MFQTVEGGQQSPLFLMPEDAECRQDRPQISLIKALHRHDGYISFMVSDGEGGMKDRVAINAKDLDSTFPQFTEQLLKNSFVSINASYRLADRKSRAAYGLPKHDSDSLRYLCACYVDIDYYNLGHSSLYVKKKLLDMEHANQIPRPTMQVDSGKGMWLLWMLHDQHEPEWAHLGAYSDNRNDHLQLYTRINKDLHRRLAHLGADAIHDGARHIRVPGSFRNDEETYVEWALYGQRSFVQSYTLRNLAARLGVDCTPRPRKERAALEATCEGSGKRDNGWKRANQNRLAAIVTILDQRAGGLRDGCRHKGAFYYAMALRHAGESIDEARAAVCRMGRACDPPLSSSECLAAVRTGYKTKVGIVAHQKMANVLNVTPFEAEVVSQALYGNAPSGDRRYFPAASRFGEFQPVTASSGADTRDVKGGKRMAAINSILASGTVPTIRELQKMLLDKGISACNGTLQKDYAARGIKSAYGKRCDARLAGRALQQMLPATVTVQ